MSSEVFWVEGIANGKVLLRKEVLDVVEVVRVTAMDYRSSLEATGLTLDLRTVTQPPGSVNLLALCRTLPTT